MQILQPGIVDFGEVIPFDAVQGVHSVVPDQLIVRYIPVPDSEVGGMGGQSESLVRDCQFFCALSDFLLQFVA